MIINILLFENFETLDAFGPVEIFVKLPDIRINYYSEKGRLVSNLDGVQIQTVPISDILKVSKLDLLFIPEDVGTRQEVNNNILIDCIRLLSEKSQYVLTVCIGSALLACTGLLNNRKATSNKRAFEWVKSYNTAVDWQPSARWVIDGKYYTSSGISAGIDMA